MPRIAAPVAILAVLSLAPPAHAFVLPHAELEGTNGYKVVIEGFDDQVMVTARSNGAGATYAVDGTVERDRLEADLGRLGGVSVQFVPTELPRADGPRRCRNGVIVQRGVWVGAISLFAERGFTTALASSTAGEVTRLRRRCDALGRGSIEAVAAIHARRKGLRGAVFTAFDVPRGPGYVSATRAHTQDGTRIVDFASDRVGRGRLQIDHDGAHAWVDPHPPFTGEARFRRGSGQAQRWRGDLGVAFPGGDTVRLAGPRFQALAGDEEVALAAASLEALLGLPF
jgi:hypothetical protein